VSGETRIDYRPWAAVIILFLAGDMTLEAANLVLAHRKPAEWEVTARTALAAAREAREAQQEDEKRVDQLQAKVDLQKDAWRIQTSINLMIGNALGIQSERIRNAKPFRR
jgi:hypothetical protein